MKLIIGSGTPIEAVPDGYIVVTDGCVCLYRYQEDGCSGTLLVAYKLQSGETVRLNGDGNYEVTL